MLPLLLIALFPGLCAAAKTAEPAMPERLEKREAATRITYQGGDGSSFEKAVVIAGAKSSMDGVPAERKWLKKKYGNYEKLKQALDSRTVAVAAAIRDRLLDSSDQA